jgi:AraC-like DNA-binding protein
VLETLMSHGPVVKPFTHERSALDLHCLPIGAGYERRENEVYDWEGSQRGAFCLIQHTISGRGALDYAGTRHVLGPGDCMVLTFPHANRYWLEPGNAWEYFWLGLHGREALRLTRAVLDERGPVIRPGRDIVDRLAAACLRLATEDLALGQASALTYGAAMALLDASFAPQSERKASLPGPLRRAVALVEADLSQPLHVGRLAAAAGMSRAHFVRAFSAALGVPPAEYVFTRRIALAERLLLATDGTVESIARAAGFSDGNYFAKAFRRVHGLSPNAYRAARVESLRA